MKINVPVENQDEEIKSLVGNFGFSLKEDADPKLLNVLQKIGNAMAIIFNAVKGIKVQFPKLYKVQGVVDIDSMPDVTVANLRDLDKRFISLEDKIGSLAFAISRVPPPKIESPVIQFPKQEAPTVVVEGSSAKDLAVISKAFIKRLDELEQTLSDILKKEGTAFPTSISVDNFPPTMTPQPVTNININSLLGLVHTTVNTVTSSLTVLPSYGNLEHRKGLIFFNTSTTVTIYIGGSDVTVANGYPVAPETASPSFDSGPLQQWYGVTSSGSANVRCAELANESGV
mgnify:CR=1 FL=1